MKLKYENRTKHTPEMRQFMSRMRKTLRDAHDREVAMRHKIKALLVTYRTSGDLTKLIQSLEEL